MQKSNMKMNALDFHSIGRDDTRICRKTLLQTVSSFFLRLKKSWKMIFNVFICLLLLFYFKITPADQKFEGIIASVDSEAITTYDLSERIKLVLKSLKLEDNIKNRDSVRDRVLELLIIEKLKKIEAKKADITADIDEIIELAAAIYNFPVEEFEEFELFLENENIDSEVVVEQLKNELLWKKLSQQMFATKITINSADIDAILNNYKNKVGKIEFDFSEIIFLNQVPGDWESSKKKMKTVISLLESGTSFELLANKFSDLNPQGNKLKTGWVFEDSLDSETKEILNKMSPGDVKTNIKINNGFKILKLNRKRRFGNEQIKFSFIKFSSLNKKQILNMYAKSISCENIKESEIEGEIKFLKIKDMASKDLSNLFLTQLDISEEKSFSNVFELDGEYNLLYVCEKKVSTSNNISREAIERRAFSKKFNQLTNTYLSNIRKSTNIKFFNK